MKVQSPHNESEAVPDEKGTLNDVDVAFINKCEPATKPASLVRGRILCGRLKSSVLIVVRETHGPVRLCISWHCRL